MSQPPATSQLLPLGHARSRVDAVQVFHTLWLPQPNVTVLEAQVYYMNGDGALLGPFRNRNGGFSTVKVGALAFKIEQQPTPNTLRVGTAQGDGVLAAQNGLKTWAITGPDSATGGTFTRNSRTERVQAFGADGRLVGRTRRPTLAPLAPPTLWLHADVVAGVRAGSLEAALVLVGFFCIVYLYGSPFQVIRNLVDSL